MLPCYLLDKQGCLQSHALLIHPGPEPLPHALYHLSPLPGIQPHRGPAGSHFASPLHEISTHSLVAMELGSQGLEKHRGGSWVREGMDGRERGRGRMQGRGHLVFLQGR